MLKWVGEISQPPLPRVICSAHYGLWSTRSTRPQVFWLHVVKQLRVSLESLVMHFQKHLSSVRLWCLTDVLSRACDWDKKNKFIPTCLSDEATKLCFISALGQLFCINIFKTGSLLTPRYPDQSAAIPDSVCCRFKSVRADVIQRNKHTHLHTHAKSTSIQSFSGALEPNKL